MPRDPCPAIHAEESTLASVYLPLPPKAWLEPGFEPMRRSHALLVVQSLNAWIRHWNTCEHSRRRDVNPSWELGRSLIWEDRRKYGLLFHINSDDRWGHLRIGGGWTGLQNRKACRRAVIHPEAIVWGFWCAPKDDIP